MVLSIVTLKRLRKERDVGDVGVNPPPAVFFPIFYFLERYKDLFFVTFNVITSHIFPENFNEIPQVDRKIGLKIFFANIIYFRQFFGFFDAN